MTFDPGKSHVRGERSRTGWCDDVIVFFDDVRVFLMTSAGGVGVRGQSGVGGRGLKGVRLLVWAWLKRTNQEARI